MYDPCWFWKCRHENTCIFNDATFYDSFWLHDGAVASPCKTQQRCGDLLFDGIRTALTRLPHKFILIIKGVGSSQPVVAGLDRRHFFPSLLHLTLHSKRHMIEPKPTVCMIGTRDGGHAAAEGGVSHR